ncbi:TetR/AcrR family transcriptional regulator [Streptosporangium sp. KLBMP 9127]|nr:TetR/AcrR family transcriptional regulator [Streptosporangium sp. KLBMP 9127]
MPRARSQSRQQIIDSARTLMCRQGYQATGLAEIIQTSGAPKGSVYFLFPGGKEQIATEAIAASTTEFNAMIEAAFEAAGSLSEWVHLMVGHFARSLETSGYTEGCPITTVTLDSAPGSPALTRACREAYDTWLASLARGLAGHGFPEARARSLALFLLTSLEGALALCRAYQSTHPLTEMAPYALTVLGHRESPAAEVT